MGKRAVGRVQGKRKTASSFFMYLESLAFPPCAPVLLHLNSHSSWPYWQRTTMSVGGGSPASATTPSRLSVLLR